MSHNRIRFAWRTAAIAFLAAATPAIAEDVTEIPEIVITAGFTATPAQKVGSAVTIVQAEDIERTGAVYIGDILRAVPGLSVSRQGPDGAVTQVRVRGAEANQVQVLIDGVEVNTTLDGDFDFSRLTTADIERIEVIRGPQSGVHGANALAGLISITTRSGRGMQGFKVRSSIEAGSFGTATGYGGIYGGTGPFDLAFSTTATRTRGINTAPSGSEKDGNRALTVNAKAGVNLGAHMRLEAVGRHVVRDTEFDDQFGAFLSDAAGAFSDGRESSGRVTLLADAFDGVWTHKLEAALLDQQLTTTQPSFAPFDIFTSQGTRQTYSYQSDGHFRTGGVLAANHTLTAYGDVERETFRQFGAAAAPLLADKRIRTAAALASEYRVEFDQGLTLSGVMRRDFNDDFEDATTWRATGSYVYRDTGSRLHGSVGRGVTNPSFIEQFGFFPPFVGNPSLKPESSIGWDIGLEQSFFNRRAVIDVTYFEANLKDEITTVFGIASSTAVNLAGTSKRRGVEVAATLRPARDIDVTGSYTYLRASEPDGRDEVRRPKHQGSLSATYRFLQDRARLTVSADYNGRMKDDAFFFPAVRIELDDYLLVGLTGSYQLTDRVKLFARAENLLDDDYQEVFSFQTPGIAAYAGIAVEFGGK